MPMPELSDALDFEETFDDDSLESSVSRMYMGFRGGLPRMPKGFSSPQFRAYDHQAYQKMERAYLQSAAQQEINQAVRQAQNSPLGYAGNQQTKKKSKKTPSELQFEMSKRRSPSQIKSPSQQRNPSQTHAPTLGLGKKNQSNDLLNPRPMQYPPHHRMPELSLHKPSFDYASQRPVSLDQWSTYKEEHKGQFYSGEPVKMGEDFTLKCHGEFSKDPITELHCDLSANTKMLGWSDKIQQVGDVQEEMRKTPIFRYDLPSVQGQLHLHHDADNNILGGNLYPYDRSDKKIRKSVNAYEGAMLDYYALKLQIEKIDMPVK
jgi:hypothetical protein